jgi:hypothetical protein
MLATWLHDLESLEQISQNGVARRLFLRMAAMSREGTLPILVKEIAEDEGLDDEVKGTLAELAHDPAFLFAVEEYLRRTERVH